MRAFPFVLPLLLAALVLPLAAGDAPGRRAVFTDATGAHLATFAYEGDCVGEGVVTLTIHRPGGDDVRVVPVESASLLACDASLRCPDCPPLPAAYAWTLTGPGVTLAGGGPAYYQYDTYPLALVLSGAFQEGALVVAGAR